MIGNAFSKRGYVCATIDFSMPTEFNADTVYLYGYFGKIQYIREIKDTLQKDIQLKGCLSDRAMDFLNKIEDSKRAVGVSVRYGNDYRSLGWPICTPEFYKSGMKKIKEEHGDCTFFVFSDVLKEVQEEDWFKDFNVVYVDGLNVVESFTLLKSCNDFVIANSTFSWWASWLGDYPNKIVYAPNYFYSEMYRHKYDELMIFKEERFLDYKTGEETDSPKFLG